MFAMALRRDISVARHEILWIAATRFELYSGRHVQIRESVHRGPMPVARRSAPIRPVGRIAELSVARKRTEELWIFVWNGLELIGIRERFPMIRNIRPSL